LKTNGLIRSEIIFQINLRNNGAAGKLKAGVYTLNTGMDMDTIISELTKGGANKDTIRVTIPEGYEIIEIAEKLENEGLIDGEEFLRLTGDKKEFEDDYPFLKEVDSGDSLEGYLFPSTY